MKNNVPFKLTVPQPCSENWNNMLPVQGGKHCESCNKKVIDFTRFTDQQLQDYFKNHSGNTCGRLLKDQTQRIIQIKEPGTRSKLLPQIIVSTLLYLGISKTTDAQQSSSSQTQTFATNISRHKVTDTEKDQKSGSNSITGIVTNSTTGEPIPFASVLLKSGDSVITSTTTNLEGEFKIIIPEIINSNNLAIHVSDIIYEPWEIKLPVQQTPLIVIMIMSPKDSFDIIETYTTGGFIYYEEPSIWQKIKNFIKSKIHQTKEEDLYNEAQYTEQKNEQPFIIETKDSIRTICNNESKIVANVYPNPMQDFIIVELKEKNTFQYILTNSSGEQITEGSLTELTNRINVINQPPGIYILHLNNPSGIKLESIKIIKGN